MHSNISSASRPLRYVFALLILSSTLIFSQCTQDNEEDLYPENLCDTTAVTYLGTIAPIMATHCNSCHGSAAPSGEVITENYAGLSLVAKNGKLWAAVSHNGPKPMPQNADKLNDCDLAKIRTWIRNGSPDN